MAREQRLAAKPEKAQRINVGHVVVPDDRLRALASLASRSHGVIELHCESYDGQKVHLIAVVRKSA